VPVRFILPETQRGLEQFGCPGGVLTFGDCLQGVENRVLGLVFEQFCGDLSRGFRVRMEVLNRLLEVDIRVFAESGEDIRNRVFIDQDREYLSGLFAVGNQFVQVVFIGPMPIFERLIDFQGRQEFSRRDCPSGNGDLLFNQLMIGLFGVVSRRGTVDQAQNMSVAGLPDLIRQVFR